MNLSNEFLDQMRMTGDAAADQAIAAIMQHQDINDINAVFRTLTSNDGIPDNIPEELKSYLEATLQHPEGLDDPRMKIGQRVYVKYGPSICLVLFCQSLPECYACARGARVLYETGRTTDEDPSFMTFARRLMETAQFVLNVMWVNAFSEGGNGHITIQKIRLIHAAIRYYLKQKGWNTDLYGVPINQEDLAGTNLAFGVTIPQGLAKIGIQLTDEEREGYYYVWRMIGHLMGIHPELIADDFEQGVLLKETIIKRNKEESEAGTVLTRSAMEFMDHLMPGTMFDGFAGNLMHHLLEDDLSDVLNIHEKHRNLLGFAMKFLEDSNRFTHMIEEHSGIVFSLTRKVERKFLTALYEHFNERKKIYFYIPPSLKKDWDLNYLENV